KPQNLFLIMKKNATISNGIKYYSCNISLPLPKFYLIGLMLLLLGSTVMAQSKRIVRGTVVDELQNPLIGASVSVKGAEIRSMINVDGKFSIDVSADKNTLTVSYIGMVTQEIDVRGKTEVRVVLKDDMALLNEVVVVGYGTQKKESVVAAITQTTGKVLERAGGVSSIGAALTGNVPGEVTTSSTGMPGEEY